MISKEDLQKLLTLLEKVDEFIDLGLTEIQLRKRVANSSYNSPELSPFQYDLDRNLGRLATILGENSNTGSNIKIVLPLIQKNFDDSLTKLNNSQSVVAGLSAGEIVIIITDVANEIVKACE